MLVRGYTGDSGGAITGLTSGAHGHLVLAPPAEENGFGVASGFANGFQDDGAALPEGLPLMQHAQEGCPVPAQFGGACAEGGLGGLGMPALPLAGAPPIATMVPSTMVPAVFGLPVPGVEVPSEQAGVFTSASMAGPIAPMRGGGGEGRYPMFPAGFGLPGPGSVGPAELAFPATLPGESHGRKMSIVRGVLTSVQALCACVFYRF